MFFNQVEEAPVDAIFGLSSAFHADPRATKVNLSVGVYKSADLKTSILNSVRNAEKYLLTEEKTKDYLPIDGCSEFLEKTGVLIFGESLWKEDSKRVAAAQSIGGTGALRLGGDFFIKEISSEVFISDPSWPNHRGVFSKVGFNVSNYPYYDRERDCVDFENLIIFLKGLPPKSIVVLHACCHNPTGADLTIEQWKILSELFFDKKLFPFFDFAYQGFGKSLDEDAKAIRLFAEAGHEMAVASSYSKNFALYSERIGALFILTASEKAAKHVRSQIKVLIRTNYSNPSRHGASIVATILGNKGFRDEWELEVTKMRERIAEMRHAFARALIVKNPRFNFLEHRNGLFSFCGLKKEQVEKITREYGIYMTLDGRINVAGLNWDNLDYVVSAILSVL